MNRRGGALALALLAPVLANGSDATGSAKQKQVLWTDEWRMYRNLAYCYTIRLPDATAVDTAGLASVSDVDTTDVATVKLRLALSTRDPDTGREVRPSWAFLITVTPNPEGVTKDKWLEPGSRAPAASTGMATIVAILKRRDTRVAGRPAIMKRMEGDGQRRDVYFVPYAGRMYALSYPVLDLDHQKILDTQSQIFEAVLGTFHFADPERCRPAGASP
jgi:hypothetical protein